MLVGLSGPSAAGKSTIASYLVDKHEFELLLLGDEGRGNANDASPSKDGLWFKTAEALSDFMLSDNNWQRDFVIDSLETFAALDVLRRRPFFVLLYVDAPVSYRARRLSTASSDSTLVELIKRDDSSFHDLALLNSLADLRIVNSAPSLVAFNSDLGGFISPSSLSERCRPSWDTYFMHLASLAARRSNCMKRRVGCILVRDRRVIATGYNGTPRGVRNCSEGGCARCNGGAKCGTALDTCLCLHAEENALLEAGRER
jgi:dCMP deaminase